MVAPSAERAVGVVARGGWSHPLADDIQRAERMVVVDIRPNVLRDDIELALFDAVPDLLCVALGCHPERVGRYLRVLHLVLAAAGGQEEAQVRYS